MFNLLEWFLLISGGGILLITFFIGKKERLSVFHFFIFGLVGLGLIIFVLFPDALRFLGGMFGMERGAEVLTYASIIFLLYFSLFLLKKTESNREEISKLVRTIAVERAKHAKK